MVLFRRSKRLVSRKKRYSGKRTKKTKSKSKRRIMHGGAPIDDKLRDIFLKKINPTTTPGGLFGFLLEFIEHGTEEGLKYFQALFEDLRRFNDLIVQLSQGRQQTLLQSCDFHSKQNEARRNLLMSIHFFLDFKPIQRISQQFRTIEHSINASKLLSLYNPAEIYGFSPWVLHIQKWTGYSFHDTRIYYYDEERADSGVYKMLVEEMVLEREPCNIAMTRHYHEDLFAKHFGWKHGAYRNSTPRYLYPNIAIYANAWVPKVQSNIHVINVTGYAFDNEKQPDYIFFTTQYKTPEAMKEALVKCYEKMWLKTFAAAKQLQHDDKITRIRIANVGGGYFSEKLPDIYRNKGFIQHIFLPSFQRAYDLFQLHGIEVIGFNFQKNEFDHKFRVPTSLATDGDYKKTLYVNAWDPWSIIGNGNAGDPSLDGAWGACSNMSILGWPMTNPYLLLQDKKAEFYKNVVTAYLNVYIYLPDKKIIVYGDRDQYMALLKKLKNPAQVEFPNANNRPKIHNKLPDTTDLYDYESSTRMKFIITMNLTELETYLKHKRLPHRREFDLQKKIFQEMGQIPD